MTTKTTAKKTTTKKAPAPIPDLPANPFIFEVLQVICKQRTKAKKIEALRKFDHPSLRAILIWNFDTSLVSMLPEGEVPYASTGEQTAFSGQLSDKIGDAVNKMNEIGSQSLGSQDQGRTSIRKEYKIFYNFLKGGNDGLSKMRRETMFINLLQGLHPLEAEILCLCKDKKLDTKYKLTQAIIAEAYPNITWGNRS
jgi:hypothetical protein